MDDSQGVKPWGPYAIGSTLKQAVTIWEADLNSAARNMPLPSGFLRSSRHTHNFSGRF